jgi:hypothetical protein
MKLHKLEDISMNSDGLVCRQGRLMGVISAVVLAGAFVAAPLVWFALDAPWFVWGMCLLAACVVVPLVLADARSRFRDTNWLLWIRPDGIWINFRSYQDSGPIDAVTVVQIDYSEITEAYSLIETYSTPSHRATTLHRLKSLNFLLNHDETEELQAAIAENRRREPLMRTLFPGIRTASKPTVFAVSMPVDHEIKINWRGGESHWTAPKLSQALAALSHYVTIGEPRRENAANWRKLSDEEFDAQVLSLVEAGSRLDAIKLLSQRRGLSTTAAHQFVDALHCHR